MGVIQIILERSSRVFSHSPSIFFHSLSVYPALSLSLCLSFFLSLTLSLCLSLSPPLFVFLSICLFLSVSDLWHSQGLYIDPGHSTKYCVQARAKLPKKRRRVVNVDVSEVRRNRNRTRTGTGKLTMGKLGMSGKLGEWHCFFLNLLWHYQI